MVRQQTLHASCHHASCHHAGCHHASWQQENHDQTLRTTTDDAKRNSIGWRGDKKKRTAGSSLVRESQVPAFLLPPADESAGGKTVDSAHGGECDVEVRRHALLLSCSDVAQKRAHMSDL